MPRKYPPVPRGIGLTYPQWRALATMHRCPSCDALICSPGYMRQPRQCIRRKETTEHGNHEENPVRSATA